MKKLLKRCTLVLAIVLLLATAAIAGDGETFTPDPAEGYYLVTSNSGWFDDQGNEELDTSWGYQYEYEFDAAGRVTMRTTKTVLEEGFELGGDCCTYRYDDAGNCIQKIEDGYTYNYAYDTQGRLVRVTRVDDFDDYVTEYVYDADGNCIQKGDFTCTYTNTDSGLVIVEDCGWKQLTYTYDRSGKLVKYEEDLLSYNEETKKYAGIELRITVKYTYDENGNPAKKDELRRYGSVDGVTFAHEEHTYVVLGYEKLNAGGADVVENKTPFTDVRTNKFYYEPVLWAVEKGITQGDGSSNTFNPDGECTRGQVVTFLWRAAGEPEPNTTEHSFTDVKEGKYYYKAMLWAVEKGITNGLTATTFGPDEKCSRAEFVTFLWRAEQKPAAQGSTSFTDTEANRFYTDAVVWAAENNITNGDGSDTIFNPTGECSRGQVVTFLYRAYH